MANLTSVEVRFHELLDDDLKPMEVEDWDLDKFKPLVNAFKSLSYQGEGTYHEDGRFSLCGRWSFEGNFNFTNEMIAIQQALRDLGAYAIHFDYWDTDIAMNWAVEGVGGITLDDGWVDDVVSYTYDELITKFNMTAPVREDFENEDAYDDARFEFICEVEFKFLELAS